MRSRLAHLRELLVETASCDHNAEALLRALGEFMEAEVAPLRNALEDLRTHGTRHDLNPTLVGAGSPVIIPSPRRWVMGVASPGGRGWSAYLKSMDDHVRQKAHIALEQAGYIRETPRRGPPSHCTPNCTLYAVCPIRGTDAEP